MSGFHRLRKMIACSSSKSWVAGYLAIVLMAGCSGIKTYPNTLEKNLRVQTEMESGSLFSSIRAAVDIYRVGNNCQTQYEGTVQLNEPVVNIGIPQDRDAYLVFVFANSSFLGNTSGQISHGTMFTPRPGRRYDVKVRYMEDIYSVTLWDSGKEIARRDLNSCSPA